MRILQICSAKTIGGGERHIADLSNGLSQRDHQIFAALVPDSPLIKLLDLQARNIKICRIRNAFDLISAFKISKFINENRIEIIHAHDGRDYNLAAICSALTGKPFVLTRHVLFPMKKTNKLSLRNAGGVIAVSRAVAESLKRQNIFAPERIHTIYNGVKLEHFNLPKTQNPEFVVGTIGQLAPIKGHDVFIRAAQFVLEKRSDVRFIIVGEDNSPNRENRKSLEKLIIKSGLSEKVEFAGWTDDVRALLAKFDLFVSAARSESFGLVIVEAMAAGVPVIATKTEGAAEIVENDKSGKLVAIEDPQDLAVAILTLFSDEKARGNLATNARKRAADHFSLEKMIIKTEDFYRSVLRKT